MSNFFQRAFIRWNVTQIATSSHRAVKSGGKNNRAEGNNKVIKTCYTIEEGGCSVEQLGSINIAYIFCIWTWFENNIGPGIKTCDLHVLVSGIDVEIILCFWILLSKFCCYSVYGKYKLSLVMQSWSLRVLPKISNI